ncbi:MAG: putative toxin-antitoxin system toxin component, PIN family [Candidatus Gottesmanbacteria bacterium]|nr:putative toxin-antitoxin system toxin component, PIN family [Candidatus Gottesmanbacteria bacterium]
MGKSSNVLRVVIDTNVLVSAIVYGGIPKQILALVVDEHITGVATRVLVAELIDVLSKKFHFSTRRLADSESLIQDSFLIIQPEKTIALLDDDDDNRVLEAAAEGACGYIVTGDTDLLRLKQYKAIAIMTPAEFLEMFEGKN